MATSKLQDQIKYRLRVLFHGYTFSENYYPAWLINPKTGKGMELDFWLPDVKIAIEVQGRQHYEYVPYFHGTVENFQKQLERDRVKKEACKAYGVLLWEIYEFGDIDKCLKEVGSHSTDVIKHLRKKNVALNALAFFAAELTREHARGTGHPNRKRNRNRRPDQSKIDDLTRKMLILCHKYNIPLKSVAPDFSIKKMGVAFPQNPIIWIKLRAVDQSPEGTSVPKERTILKVKAVIVNIKYNGRIITARWQDKPPHKAPRWIERDFDLWGSMSSIGHYERIWRLDEKSLPRLSDYPHLFDVYGDTAL